MITHNVKHQFLASRQSIYIPIYIPVYIPVYTPIYIPV